MNQSEGAYNLISLVDDLEGATFYAKEKEMSPGIINGLETVHDTMAKLEPLVKTPAHEKRVKADLEKIIQELKVHCKKGDERLALGQMRTLRDRVNALKAILSKA